MHKQVRGQGGPLHLLRGETTDHPLVPATSHFIPQRTSINLASHRYPSSSPTPPARPNFSSPQPVAHDFLLNLLIQSYPRDVRVPKLTSAAAAPMIS